MSGCLMWTLLFVSCLAGNVAGQLQEPLNVKIISRNFSLFLAWLPAPENPSTVTYEVQSTITFGNNANESDRWTQVPACENISITECDFTCALMDSPYLNHGVRVRTASPSRSSWVTIQDIQYMFTVDPDPPNLSVTQGAGNITIDIFTQKPFCAPPIIFKRSLNYFVMIWRKYNPKEVIFEQEVDEPSITRKSLGYNGEYCVAAKIIYRTDTIKESKFSHPICLNLAQKDGHYNTVLIATLLFSIIFGAAVIVSVLIWCKITVKSKKPKALDFSSSKHCQKNPCLPELYSDTYYSLTIYNIPEQVSSIRFLPPNKYDDGACIYPITGQGYMERPAMQTSGSHRQEYFSSKDFAFNSSSDKSSSDCTCANTSGSASDTLFKEKNNQTNHCPKDMNITASGDVQMFSSTSMSVSNLFDSLPIMDSNSIVNVPFNTLCIGGNGDHMDNSDGESDNQCFTNSEDGLDSLSTDYKTSDSKYSSQDEKTHKDCTSDYTQTYTSRRC